MYIVTPIRLYHNYLIPKRSTCCGLYMEKEHAILTISRFQKQWLNCKFIIKLSHQKKWPTKTSGTYIDRVIGLQPFILEVVG